jgi:DNA-directed RNA polymerase specialized sigma24 family protein
MPADTNAIPADDRVQRREMAEVIARELAAMPQIYREIIELIIFQDMTYETASDILGGISLGTLRSRMFHALRMLRQRLEAVAGPGAHGII